MASFAGAVVLSLLCALTIIALAVYITKGKRFLNSVKGNRNVKEELVSFGLILVVMGCIGSIFAFSALSFTYVHPVLGPQHKTLEEIASYSLTLIWSVLVLISDVLVFFDGLAIMESQHPELLMPRFDLKKAAEKYPEDLIGKYIEQYPHNPDGVLEWHIHKKMKEGKTREQAIKELQDAKTSQKHA